jgi:hypothetical protein
MVIVLLSFGFYNLNFKVNIAISSSQVILKRRIWISWNVYMVMYVCSVNIQALSYTIEN